ncbi:hypothetical protein [Micromonospora tulbaghiae]|uniref:hypothetical protein n=1 Tax=Micromonospora tulbaghiae TaxID=479978 RepID=UPI0034020265
MDVYWITPGDLLIAWAAWVAITIGAVLLTVWALRPSAPPTPPVEPDAGLPPEMDVFMSAETIELPRGTGRHRVSARVGHAGQYRRGVDAPTAEVRSEAVR